MRFASAVTVLLFIVIQGATVVAQNPPEGAPASVTVPFTLDQGRVVIDADLLLPNGSIERVRAWVDNGNPSLEMNRRVANLMGLSVSCDGQVCSAKSGSVAPVIVIGGMKIPLTQVGLQGKNLTINEGAGKIKIPADLPALAPGMSAEINIPSFILRNYDVLVDFPDRRLSLGQPGRLRFNGVKSKMLLDADGLIQIPSKIENKNYDFGLDLGSSINLLSEELFNKLAAVHPDWPHMTGAVGLFNTAELSDDPDRKLMRIARMQFGPLFLSDIAVAEIPKTAPKALLPLFEQRAASTANRLTTEALMNYRVGLDYAHSVVYFDIGRTVKFPDFDVVGLILRPEGDTGFTIIGIADSDGKSSIPEVQVGDQLVAVDDNPVGELTLGQVWSLLEGSPGEERKLTIARTGKKVTFVAKVRHFLGDVPGNQDTRAKSKKN